MNSEKLAAAVRDMSETVDTIIEAGAGVPEIEAVSDDLRDVRFLLKVLAHIVDGKTVAQAFGAPGDWGYGTPIGDALAERGQAL